MTEKKILGYDFHDSFHDSFASNILNHSTTDISGINADDIITIDQNNKYLEDDNGTDTFLIDFTTESPILGDTKHNINDEHEFTFNFDHKILIKESGKLKIKINLLPTHNLTINFNPINGLDNDLEIRKNGCISGQISGCVL